MLANDWKSRIQVSIIYPSKIHVNCCKKKNIEQAFFQALQEEISNMEILLCQTKEKLKAYEQVPESGEYFPNIITRGAIFRELLRHIMSRKVHVYFNFYTCRFVLTIIYCFCKFKASDGYVFWDAKHHKPYEVFIIYTSTCVSCV